MFFEKKPDTTPLKKAEITSNTRVNAIHPDENKLQTAVIKPGSAFASFADGTMKQVFNNNGDPLPDVSFPV